MIIDVSEKILFTFNKYFYDFVKDLKKVAPELKQTLSEHYPVKNKVTDANIKLYAEKLDGECLHLIFTLDIDKFFVSTELAHVLVCHNTTIGDAYLQIPPSYRTCMLNYIYIFTLFTLLWKRSSEEGISILFDTSMSVLKAIQQSEDYSLIIDDILDEDVKTLLAKMRNSTSSHEKTSLENTKIGSIAREIADDLDLSSMNISKPEDLLNGTNTAVIGDLVSKVSSKLQQKFASGELKHDDLLKEAMSMMGTLGGGAGGDMFANIMKNMGGMMQGPSGKSNHDGASTKERLRKRLDQQKDQ
jgi:hypothetical protein